MENPIKMDDLGVAAFLGHLQPYLVKLGMIILVVLPHSDRVVAVPLSIGNVITWAIENPLDSCMILRVQMGIFHCRARKIGGSIVQYPLVI